MAPAASWIRFLPDTISCIGEIPAGPSSCTAEIPYLEPASG